MAEMFLKLDGVKGESLDDVHAEEIEIKSWSWGADCVVKWDMNQGGQSTKANIHVINLDKICDKASVMLYQCCITGKHIASATITCRKNDGAQKIEYLVVDLKDVMVSKVDWKGEGSEQSLGETVELSFAEFNIKYALQQDSGSAPGVNHFGFDIQRQKAVA
jgi:type VI secretion system secreted protein Hcp